MTSSHLPPIAQDSSVAFLDGRRADVLCFLLLLGSALATNLLHRPLLVDDTTVALEWADSVFGSEAIALSNQTEDTPPFFPFLVYLSTLLCGRTVLALHLFPLLASLFNPILVYVLFRDVFQERSRALGGALLFLLWPSALFYYNQAVAEPITLTLVLGMLLSYRRQWTALTLMLAGLSLFSAYDSMLVVAGVFLDSLRYWKQADRRAWLARGFLFLGVVTGVLALADWLILGGQFFPFYRVWLHMVTYYEHMSNRTILWSRMGWTLLYFFAVFLVIPFMIGLVRAIRSWDCWIFSPVVFCLFYELYVVRIPDAQLGVTLRHLTLIVPFCAYMTVDGFRGVSGLLTRNRPWVRRGALAGLCVGTLLVGAVQIRGHFYLSGVSGMASLWGLVEDPQTLPQFVHVTPRHPRFVEDLVTSLPGDIDPSGGPWQTVRVDLGKALRDAGQEGAIEQFENWLLRGRVTIRGMKLLDSSGEGTAEVSIPTGGQWKLVDPIAGNLRVEREVGGGESLRIDPEEEVGYLCAAYLDLDKRIRPSNPGQTLLTFEVRRESRFLLQLGTRTDTGRRRFFAVHSSLPPTLGEPKRLEIEIRGLNIDVVYHRHTGIYRPPGLYRLAPFLAHDGAWYRAFEGDQKRVFDPGGGIRVRETMGRGLSVRGAYLAPMNAEGGTYVLGFEFPRPLAQMTLAAFLAHVLPGSGVAVELEYADGKWMHLGRVSGAGGRSMWGVDLDKEVSGRREVKIRFLVRGGTIGMSVLGGKLPVGLRDLSVAVRYQEPTAGVDSAGGAVEK